MHSIRMQQQRDRDYSVQLVYAHFFVLIFKTWIAIATAFFFFIPGKEFNEQNMHILNDLSKIVFRLIFAY